MKQRNHYQRGKFNWRCLLGHMWGKWSLPRIRTHVSGGGLGLLGDDYVWTQRVCTRCGARHGVES